MQFTLATIALAAAGLVSAQGVSQTLKPSGAAPAGCSADYSSQFEITLVLPSKKRDIVERSACAGDGTLVASLKGGVLTDAKGRIGGIVANRQFQFDGPPSQTGTIYNGGFSVCNNGSLALGPSAVFYECKSGTFYNIYDQPAGALCLPVVIQVLPCGGPGGASQGSDGQPNGPSATQISDGQIQATSAGHQVTQITDGQIQATSAGLKPISQFTDGQIQVTATPKSVAVSQATDGQVQASVTKSAAVSQATDGQVQASSASTASTSAAPVTTASTLSTAVGTTSTSPSASAPATVTGSGASMISVGATFMAAAVAAVAVFLL